MSRELHEHGFWRRAWMFGNIAREHLASGQGLGGAAAQGCQVSGGTSPSQPLTPPSPAASIVPLHWTPEQALAVFECLHAVRAALWTVYGPQFQQAWRDQLVPDGPPPEFDPDEPF